MIVTLTNGATIFEIANGSDRTLQVLGEESFALSQQTQTAQRARAEWLTGFHTRARRSIALSYHVTFPQCASLEAALLQARQIPITCPRGGVLVEQLGAVAITYADAWIEGEIGVERLGITNRFIFNLTAVDPSTAELSLIAQMDSRYPNILDLAGLTGGGSTKLDGQTTTDVAIKRVVKFYLTESSILVPHEWTLLTWTDEVEDADAGIVLPDDFDEEDNAKYWHRTL